MENNEKDYMRRFSANLEYQLARHGMTQVDLAKKLGVSKQTVNYWVAQKKMPRMDKIEAIANIFGVKHSDLIDNMVVSYNLTASEQRIIYAVRQLDEKSQKMVEAMITSLITPDENNK